MSCSHLPKVSIGIPTYNRADMLKRSVESALNQDYKNIEIIISDNASTDHTKDICQYYGEKYGERIKYCRQRENIGPTANFTNSLEMASGELFMWLGDDDWIDINYVSTCVQKMLLDYNMSLVSGAPRYYRNAKKIYDGEVFCLLQNEWWRRVILYYYRVADNGMFYGLMRTAQIRAIKIPPTMAGDWLMIANVVCLGKAEIKTEISVHRELGGATASYRQIANCIGFSKMQALFPFLSAAVNAWMDIASRGAVFKERALGKRLVVASAVFIVIMLKRPNAFIDVIAKWVKKFLIY